MKFIHLQNIFRRKLLHKIGKHKLTVTMLADQTGIAQSHISNFLREKRGLSLETLDRLLDAQRIEVEELMPPAEPGSRAAAEEELDSIPLVSHNSALFEPVIRSSAVLAHLRLLPDTLNHLLPRPTAERRRWQRFVAVRIPAASAETMRPILLPGALVVIDRHYNSTHRYEAERPTLYAANQDGQLVVRYVEFISGKLVLRSLNEDPPVTLLEIEQGQRPQDLIVGRVVLVQNPM